MTYSPEQIQIITDAVHALAKHRPDLEIHAFEIEENDEGGTLDFYFRKYRSDEDTSLSIPHFLSGYCSAKGFTFDPDAEPHYNLARLGKNTIYIKIDEAT